jgi:hypothetical protein
MNGESEEVKRSKRNEKEEGCESKRNELRDVRGMNGESKEVKRSKRNEKEDGCEARAMWSLKEQKNEWMGRKTEKLV